MSLQTRFDGVYYRGREKSSVQFSLSRLCRIELFLPDSANLEISLHNVEYHLIGDPQTTLQIGWQENGERHALLCQTPELLAGLLTLNLHPDTLDQLKTLQKQQQQRLAREKHRVPVYLSLIAGFFLGGFLVLHFSAPLIAGRIPYEWERKIGGFAFENYQTGKKIIENPPTKEAINTIVQRIDQFDDAKIDYQVAIVDADMINAFAFPGGYIVVTTGLIKNSDNPEQVAAVLAHELTHVIERHGMRKIVRQAGIGVLVGIVFGDTTALSQLIDAGAKLEGLSFDRGQERNADEGAIKIMLAAGISPKNLAGFFEKIKQTDHISGNIPAIFQTHPLNAERIKYVSEAPEPDQPHKFDLDWEKVKRLE